MKLETIKEAVNKKFNLDIAKDSRQRNFTDAKKVFSKLGYETGATFREVGEQMNKSHCNVLHHVNSVNMISVDYKKKHDELIKELGLVFSKPFFNPEQEEIKKQIKQTNTSEALKRIKSITDIVSEWDIETVQEFKQTRLDPFNASLKTRIMPKTIKEVKGALVNSKYKNPVLC